MPLPQADNSITRGASSINDFAEKATGLSFDKSNVRNTPTDAINAHLGRMSFLQYPADRPKYYTQILISTYNRNKITEVGKLTTRNTVLLPLPENLTDPHHVQYDESPMGIAGAVIDQAGAGAGSILASAAIKMGETALLGKPGGGTGEGGVPIVADALGAAVSGGVDALRVLGYSPNEYVTILFKGPQYKRHTIKWKMSANHFDESVSLRNIINLFNNSMAPGMYASGLLFTFPDIFQIAYMPNPGYLYKFKPCVCEAMFTNFSAGGSPSFYRDAKNENNPHWEGGVNDYHNAPESIEIEMHFIELEYFISGDFKMTNSWNDAYAQFR